MGVNMLKCGWFRTKLQGRTTLEAYADDFIIFISRDITTSSDHFDNGVPLVYEGRQVHPLPQNLTVPFFRKISLENLSHLSKKNDVTIAFASEAEYLGIILDKSYTGTLIWKRQSARQIVPCDPATESVLTNVPKTIALTIYDHHQSSVHIRICDVVELGPTKTGSNQNYSYY